MQALLLCPEQIQSATPLYLNSLTDMSTQKLIVRASLVSAQQGNHTRSPLPIERILPESIITLCKLDGER